MNYELIQFQNESGKHCGYIFDVSIESILTKKEDETEGSIVISLIPSGKEGLKTPVESFLSSSATNVL